MRELLPGVKYHFGAKALMIKSEDGALQRLPGTVGLVAAGGADNQTMDLTKLLLQHLGAFVIAKNDLSSANMQTLVGAAPALQVCDVVIVVAGADPGLPTAVAGFVDVPVLAVPTSDAWAPPRGAAPVAVTAADGGVGAAVTAARMLRTAATRAMHIAEMAAQVAVNPIGAAAASGEAAAHHVQPQPF